MKMDAKTKSLLIGLLGVAIAVATWFLFAASMKEKTDALKLENEGLKAKKEEYEAVNSQRDVYEQGIVDLTTEREELLAAYPSAMTREDEIMYWANLERANSDQLVMTDISMQPWQEVFAPGYEEGYGTEDEVKTQLHLYKAPVSYSYMATYDGIKGMVNHIYAQADKKGVQQMDISFDETTGNLEGSIVMNMYYMVGTEKEYTPVSIPNVPTGLTNVFRTTNTKVMTESDDLVDSGSGEEADSED